MDYYKIFGKDGSVIAAEATEEPAYIMYQASNGAYLRCSRVKAQGVLSADSSQIYQLSGYRPMPGEHLIAEAITQAEYENLIEELDIDDDDDTEPEPSPDDEDPGSDVMSAQQMRERIIELEAENEAKDARIAELEVKNEENEARMELIENCVLEMSEVVYAGD